MVTRQIDYAVSSGAVIGNPERVAAVHATGLLDTPAEVAFDQYARLAKRLLHAAAAFVTIIDDKRVFFKSAIASVELQGTLPREVPIADSYCPYTVSAGSAFTVSDMRIDLRFEGLSTADGFNIIAYAGVPLVSAGGHAIGTLCVTDGRSREWTDDDLATLTGLAAAVSMEIELHRRVAELEKAESWLTAQRHNLCLAMDAGNINIFEWDIPSDYVSWSENPEDLILNPVAFTGTFEDFMGLIFAEDGDRVRAALKSALHGHAEYRCEFRLLRGDASVRWREMRGRVEQDRIGKPLRMIGVDIDITERKLAEGKSFEAHQRLQALMDAVPVGVSYWEDASCQHVTGNRALLAQFGAAAEDNLSASAPLETAAGRQICYFQDGELMSDADLPLQRAVAENRAIPPTELEIHMPDGRCWFAEASGAPISNSQGKVTSGVAVLVDITARKLAQTALRTSEEQLRQLYAASPHPAWVYAIDSLQFLAVNPAATALYGYSEEEFLRMQLADIRLPEDVPYLMAQHHRVLAGEIVGAPFRHQTKSGEALWVETSVQVLTHGYAGRRAALVQITDVTQRRRAEAALRESEAQLQLIAQALPVYIVRCDAELRYLFVNKAYAERFASTPEQLVGKRLPDVVGESAYRSVKPHLARLLDGHAVQFEMTIPYVGVGSRFMRSANVPDFDEVGKVRGFIGVLIDLTDRKRAEDALKESDRRKDAFLAMLAHELRSPLAPIHTAAELLRRLNVDIQPARHAAEIVARQAAHMARLVDDLMDISRVGQGKIVLKRSPLELSELINDGVELARPFVDAKSHALVLTLPDEPLYVLGDPVRLAQVVGNLLNNAAKYTEEYGRIGVSLAREDQYAIVTVQDNGIGIDKDVLPHVFDLFTQADSSLDRADGGLGIGLSLVKSLVELHEGRVAVESEGLNRGSTFRVWLPLIAAPAAHKVTPNAPRRVLVADDNVDSAASRRGGTPLTVKGSGFRSSSRQAR